MKTPAINPLSNTATGSKPNLTPGDWLFLVLQGKMAPFLDGKFVCPSDKQPISESNTTGDDLIERAIRSRGIKDSTAAITLGNEAILTLENKLDDLLSLKERKEIIEDVLCMAKIFPVSDPNHAVEVLHKAFKRSELKKWPSPNIDSHKLVLEALTKKLETATEIPENLIDDLVDELSCLDYGKYASDALLQLPSEREFEKLFPI